MSTTQPCFEVFLNDCIDRGITEFRLVARRDGPYTTSFYLHALGHDSETMDYDVDEDRLTTKYKEEATR